MTKTKKAKSLRGRIDFVVITIREDEYETVLKRFAPTIPVYGGRQFYEYRRLRRADGSLVSVAVLRAFDQGQSVAQLVTRDAIDDLAPKWIVLTGIAGAVPDSEFTLGDVLLASSLHDFSVTAENDDKPPQFRAAGGPMHPAVQRFLGHLPAWRNRLGNWNDHSNTGGSKPHVDVPDDIHRECYYGKDATREKVRGILQGHFTGPGMPRLPLFRIGALATSNVLLKDTQLLQRWKEAARHITHIEMEAGGAHMAASHATPNALPLLSLRGISDVVGFVRSDAWTQFACEAAASFLFRIITTLPAAEFEIGSPPPGILWVTLAQLPETARRASARIIDGVAGVLSHSLELLRSEPDAPPTLEAIRSAFAKSSKPLVSRTVDPSERIPRPELTGLEARFSSDTGKVLCVLGSAGSGKTALLALLAQNAAKRGIATLAIKADLLPAKKPFEDWGSRELHKEISAIDAVRVVASRERVFVVVDQLDALSSIVAVRSDLFNTVVEFVCDCAALPNVSVVCSCREFDYLHDARFEELEADEVHLELPPWEEVAKQLANNGISGAEQWSLKFREVLRTPQHLRIFLDRFNATGRADFRGSYHLMLDDLWARNVSNDAERDLLDALTEHLMQIESLWAPAAAFEQHGPAIKTLKSKGLLESQGLQIGFKHQTLLEHAKARFFTKTTQSFSEYALSHQDTLQVRPTVWAVLQYLREAALEKYRAEIEALFSAVPRLHLRYLLIEFLGKVQSPEEFEKVLLADRLMDAVDRIRVLLSIRGNKAWFDAFRATHFPTIMRGDAQTQWPLVGVIHDAWNSDHDVCFDLIKSYWFADPAKDGLTEAALRETDKWDTREVDMACAVIQRSPHKGDRLYWAESLVYVVSASRPDLAPRVFVETMKKLSEPATGDGANARTRYSPLESGRDWYELPAVAEAAPVEFLRESWAWLTETCTTFHNVRYSTVVYRYDGTCTAMDEESHRPESPVLAACVAAVEGAARLDPMAFIDITKPSWESENLIVHRFILNGLAIVAASMPEIGLQYLAGDRRRLWVGSRESHGHSDSIELIAAIAPALKPDDLHRLESIIVAYTQYREGKDLCDDRLGWDREARLRLLNAIPPTLRSAAVSKLVEAEKIALPGWNREVPGGRSGFVRHIPPITRQEMAAASEDQIVEVIMETADEPSGPREWIEIEGGWEEPGGARDAGHELAELAKDNPQKVVEVIKRLVANGKENAASAAVSGLSDSSLTDDEVLSFARALTAQPIHTEDLRHGIAYLVYRRSKPPNGIPDDICSAIRGWLEAAAQKPEAETETPDPEESKVRDDGNSVLWGDAGTIALRSADNSFWLLLAITEGYLRRASPRIDDWLDLVEQLLAGNIPERTWATYCYELRRIRAIEGDKHRGAAVVAALFDRFPHLLRRREGVHLVARIGDLLPEQQLRAVLTALRGEEVPVFRQSYGELLTLFAYRDDQHGWVRDLLAEELSNAEQADQLDEPIVLGIAHAAANLWDEPDLRTHSVSLLARLIPLATDRIGGAISTVFQTTLEFAADDTTDQLLQTLVANPGPLARIPIADLVPHLISLLPHKRELILAICQAILSSRSAERELFEVGPQLVKISMTLQRFPDTRVGALDFFEQLLRLGLDDAFRVLRDIDIQPSNKPEPRRRERRRRRRG